MFTQDDARWLSQTVGALYAAQTMRELTRTAMDAVDERFKLLHSSCEELGGGGSLYIVHGLRTSSPPPADYAAYIHDNPIIPITENHPHLSAIQMRQHSSMTEWSHTDHFNGIARPMGFNDQLTLVARMESSFIGIGLYRDTVFSDNEFALGSLLQPHLLAAWRRVRGCELNPKFGGPLRMTVSPGLLPLSLSPTMRRALKAYFPDWRDDRSLPATVRIWLSASVAELQRRPPTTPMRALTVESARGRLLIRCFLESCGLIQLIMVETPAVPNFFLLRQAGLTARECEVLHWIARGKRDAEIAAILGTAPATISKHVENILPKLGAENRAACVATALEFLQIRSQQGLLTE